MARKSWHSLSEFEALRAFMEAGTASAAAARLGISQSAVSRSISNLESRTGRVLFERDGGRLRPTFEAIQMNRRLDPLFEALERIDGPTEISRETLSLVAPPSYTHRYLVDLCASFVKVNPHFNLRIQVGTNDDIPRFVLDNSCDLALIGVDMTRSGLKTTAFKRSPTVCAIPRGHRLASREVILPADLKGEDLISLTQNNVSRGKLDRILSEAGVHQPPVVEVDTWQLATDFVGANLGVAILNPFPSAFYSGDGLVFRRFESPISFTTAFIFSNDRPLSRVGRAFLRHARLNTPKDGFSETL